MTTGRRSDPGRRGRLPDMRCQAASRSAIAVAVAIVAVACGSSGPSSRTASSPAASSAAGSASSPASATPSVPSGQPASAAVGLTVREYDVPAGSHPHDVSPAADGGVWYTGQHVGVLGHLDPATGTIRQIRLGEGSSPHGVITGPDGAAWITDSGLNAIVRVDPATDQIRSFPLPPDRSERQPEHSRLRSGRHALVHRPVRRLRPLRSGERCDDGLRRTRGSWTVRHHRRTER